MSSLKEPFILNESQCDNLKTQSSDKSTRKHNTHGAIRSKSTSIEKTTIEVINDTSLITESLNSINNNNSRSFENRNSFSSYIETIKFSNELENSIHQRYIDYFNLSQKQKDTSKTDYTYAHSFAYSALIPIKNKFNWLVPNMSRQSLSTISRHSAQGIDVMNDRQSANTTSSTASSSSYHRKQTQRLTTYEMTGSSTSPNSKLRTRKSQPEYSDDDEDHDFHLSKPKVNGIRPKTLYVTSYDQNENDDDDEELTIVRRINRYFLRTFRDYTTDKKNDSITLTTSSQMNVKSSRIGNLTSFWCLFLVVAFLFGSYYTVPQESWYNLRINIDKVFSTTGSFFSGRFQSKPKIEFQNSDQIIAEIELLRNEIEVLKSKSENDKEEHLKSVPTINMPDFDNILLRLDEVERKVNSCCNMKPQKIDTIVMEENITKHIHELMTKSLNSSFTSAQNSIDQKFISELKLLESKITEFVHQRIDKLKDDALQTYVERSQKDVPSDISLFQEMIRKAILKYDADKTGEADFALESAGAWIMSTRCSETYQLNSASYKIFGLTMWKSSSSPRVVIQPGVIPGECWCFRGSEGRLGIHLSANIIPSSFTYEHIPKTLSRDGHIHSAPQSFSVYGLKTETDNNPELFGEYIFDIETDESMQRFIVQNRQIATHGFNKVELVIKSNHGHPEYTCLYRFRVHGQVQNNGMTKP